MVKKIPWYPEKRKRREKKEDSTSCICYGSSEIRSCNSSHGCEHEGLGTVGKLMRNEYIHDERRIGVARRREGSTRGAWNRRKVDDKRI